MINKTSYTFTPIGAEPVAVNDAKLYLRIDQTSDDSLVAALISSARSTAEKWLNKLIVQTTVNQTMDYLPAVGFNLPYGPVQSVTSITVKDESGTATTLDPSNYLVDLSGGRIVYTPSAVLPTSYQSIAAVQVTYVAGYGLQTDVTAIPAGIVQAIKHLVSASYENRETAEAVPPLVCALLQPFKKIVI